MRGRRGQAVRCVQVQMATEIERQTNIDLAISNRSVCPPAGSARHGRSHRADGQAAAATAKVIRGGGLVIR